MITYDLHVDPPPPRPVEDLRLLVSWLTARARCNSRDWAMLLLDSEALNRDVRALRDEAAGLVERLP